MNIPTQRPLVRFNDELAAIIVNAYRGKNLTQRAARSLMGQIVEAIRIGTAHMLTYGPDEVARIAEYFNLPSDLIRRILIQAGGRCVDDAELAIVWSRVPDGTSHEGSTPAALLPAATVEAEIIMLLHAERDRMRNLGMDTTKIPYDSGGAYYAEAFGVMRGLALADYGYLGTSTGDDPRNLRAWFHRIERAVLDEEGFDGTNVCERCFERYGHDTSRPRIASRQ